MTLSANFTSGDPISVAQGRKGEVIITQGNGVRPIKWSAARGAVEAGMDAPATKPVITVDDNNAYYIARIDVNKPGAVYNTAPSVTLSPSPTSIENPDANRLGGKNCKSKSYLDQARVSEIVVEDGGKYYPQTPNVTLSGTHGKDAELKATLDGHDEFVGAGNDIVTGLTGYNLISKGPPWEEEAGFILDEMMKYSIYKWVDVPLVNTSGYVRMAGPTFYYTNSVCNEENGSPVAGNFRIKYDPWIKVSGITSGTGGKVRINGIGWSHQTICNFNNKATWHETKRSLAIGTIVPLDYGENYNQDDRILIHVMGDFKYDSDYTPFRLVEPAPAKYDAVIRAYTGADPSNPSAEGYPLRSISIANAGSGYVVAPELKINSESGFGAYATCTVKDGKIDTVTLENGGGGYKVPPEIKVVSGEAEAVAIARPHLRGLYQCYYRYIDDTPEKENGPIPSNLSEVVEVDAGEGTQQITWSVTPPTGRAKKVELWRSTGDQAISLYKVATLDGLYVYNDDKTDEELRDSDRDDYAAMPIVLPNGDINAMRFVPPPTDKQVVVRFQDRFWYGVGGENPNAVFFSEEDEPESVPEVNEIIPMQTSKQTDDLTAIIPFSNTLLLCQSRTIYALSFATDPLADASVSPLVSRGCFNQKCFDMCDDVCYVMDSEGVYAISKSGSVESISDAIADQFRDKIKLTGQKRFFLTIDAVTKILRCFVNHVDDGASVKPTRALCYSITTKTWWHEVYPQELAAECKAKDTSGGNFSVYAGSLGLVSLDKGSTDLAIGTVVSVALSSSGAGYKKPPTVYPVGEGAGCKIEASLTPDGSISALWVLSGGRGYTSGDLYISPPEAATEEGALMPVANFIATSLAEETHVSPVMRYTSGIYEYADDKDGKGFDTTNDRSVSVSYEPQKSSTDLSLRLMYNGSSNPRPNVADVDRGNGWKSSTVDPAVRIDIGDGDASSGKGTSVLQGQTSDDYVGNDKHVAMQIVVPSRTSDPVTIYSLEARGTVQ